MNDLTILHLSDLHFDTGGAQPYKLFDALIADVKNQMKFSNNVIIVITGDIVNQANYSSKELVLKFFNQLKTVLVDKLTKTVYDIIFVPGNHDRIRTYETAVLNDSEIVLNEEFYKKFSGHYVRAYKDYFSLINEIRNVFGLTPYKDKLTYGVQEVCIDNNYYCFVCLDTAWSSKGNNDRRNLKIGKFQIDHLQNIYKKQHNKRVNGSKDMITFALAHHPLNWLLGTEEDLARNFLIGQRGIDADIFICGHTHTRDIINWSNNRQSLTTLSTGIGWPDTNDTDHSDLHAYSIYVFHLNLNSLDVYVRSTNDGGNFTSDYRIYTSEENQQFKKIVLPIHSTDLKSYFTLGTIKSRSPKVCFLSNTFMSDVQRFVFAMGCFRLFAVENIEKSISSYGEKFNDLVYQEFLAFLQSLCDLLADEILSNYEFEDDDRIRFHFRYCSNFDSDATEKIYSKLVLSYWPDVKPNEKSLSDIEWGQLIEASYLSENPLIYSANPEVCKKTTKWYDFITIIPMFPNNSFNIERQHINESRPYITFGASITSEKLQNILYCLDYYRFDKILSIIIQRYLGKIPFPEFNLPGFISYYNHAKKKSEDKHS